MNPSEPMTFVTSDLHLFHPLLAWKRGFGTQEEPDIEGHAAWIESIWRQVVRDQDTVHFLGDLTGGGAEPTERALELIDSLPGTKHAITGNHDETHPANKKAIRRQRRWMEVFDSVQPFGQTTVMIGETKRYIAMSHFPFFGDHTREERYDQWRLRPSDQWLLHGHTHHEHQRIHDGRQIHVGIDAWGGLVPMSTIAHMIHVHEQSQENA